jgi:hypothetical protein
MFCKFLGSPAQSATMPQQSTTVYILKIPGIEIGCCHGVSILWPLCRPLTRLGKSALCDMDSPGEESQIELERSVKKGARATGKRVGDRGRGFPRSAKCNGG